MIASSGERAFSPRSLRGSNLFVRSAATHTTGTRKFIRVPAPDFYCIFWRAHDRTTPHAKLPAQPDTHSRTTGPSTDLLWRPLRSPIVSGVTHVAAATNE